MRKVPVDLEMLRVPFDSQFESPWYLDLETGDVMPDPADSDIDEPLEDNPERYLLIDPDPPHDDFRHMEEFVLSLPEGEARRDLERVLRRPKPFRNFREALRDWPELRQQWFALRERVVDERAKEWLADQEIEPVPRPPDRFS